MKHLYAFLLCFCSALILSAQPFTMLTDTGNALVNFPAAGQVSFTGASWVDVNGDDLLDLFYSGNLFKNEGGGDFSLLPGVTTQGNVTALTNCSWMDMDNDGDPDLLYSSGSGFGTGIYQNDGSGLLTPMASILDTIDSSTWSAQWCDFNNDSYADMILTFASGFLGASNFPCRLYRGSATGEFSQYQDTFAFLTNLNPYTVSNWIDYDEDGDQDLFIASGPASGVPAQDFLYRNMQIETGNEGFERISNLPFATQLQDGQCYNFIDYDNDEDLDMCLTNWASGTPNRFYENNGGTYTSIVTPFNQTANTGSLTNAWGDMDNDGDLDLLITAASPASGYFVNNGDGTFTSQGNIIGPVVGGTVSGLAIGDYDNDGDLDFFTTGAQKGLFRNDQATGNHWVNVTLEGNPSNKSAVGARVRLLANLNGQSTWMRREVSSQNTFMGHNSQRVHFGLGNAVAIDSMVVNWPSGNVEGFNNLQGDQLYRIVEGQGIQVILARTEEILDPDLNFRVFPQPGLGTFWVEFEQAPVGPVVAKLRDLQGKLLHRMDSNSERKFKLEFQDLPTGVYLLEIHTEMGVRRQKVSIGG